MDMGLKLKNRKVSLLVWKSSVSIPLEGLKIASLFACNFRVVD